jgi:hypothetical protein
MTWRGSPLMADFIGHKQCLRRALGIDGRRYPAAPTGRLSRFPPRPGDRPGGLSHLSGEETVAGVSAWDALHRLVNENLRFGDYLFVLFGL